MIKLPHGSFSLTEIRQNNVQVGKYCSIGTDCFFNYEGTHLTAVDKKCVYTTNWDQTVTPKKIVIGNDVWIGRGVKIRDNVTIGNGAIIGAWSVVYADVPAYTVVVGNPVRVVRARFRPTQQEELERIRWWDWPKKVIRERREDMKDIDVFLKKYG